MSDGTDTSAGTHASGGEAPEGAGDPDERRAELERAAVAELERLLLARGPLAIEELVDAFSAEAPQLAADFAGDRPANGLAERVTALVRQGDEFWRIADGRLAPVLHHLRRATFTHRLTAGELAREAIDLSPDLIALALPRTVVRRDGTPLRTAGGDDDARASETGSLLGPPGWLQGCDAGSLVAVRYDGEHVDVEPVAADALDEAAHDAVVEALRGAFASLDGSRAPEVHRLVVDTMGGHATSFSVTVAPLVELLPTAGLQVREAWVGPADRPWPTPPEQARHRRVNELLTGADDCCRRAARRVLDDWHAWLQAPPAGRGPMPEGDATRLVEDIEHGPTAAVLAEVATVGRPRVTMRQLGEWADAVAAAAERSSAGVEYLRARGADAAGDAERAEAHLGAGLRLAAGHPACLGFLAELAADRGDAQGSLELLRQAGRSPSTGEVQELEPFVVSRQVGRNEPCPCGSGRKFKVCCARHPVQRPLVERARWLLSKATRHAVRTDPLAVQSLRHLFGTADGGGGAEALVGDMVLFANPGLARYLDARGALLPDDELACARAWTTQPMRLLAVTGTDGSGSLDAVDVKSGDRLTVVDAAAATSLAPDETILTRALPAGDVWLLTSAVVRVPPNARDRALELLEDDVRPFGLLQLLVDVQVAGISS